MNLFGNYIEKLRERNRQAVEEWAYEETSKIFEEIAGMSESVTLRPSYAIPIGFTKTSETIWHVNPIVLDQVRAEVFALRKAE